MNWSWWKENGALRSQSPPGRLLPWFWVGGSACCQETDRTWSRGPAALLGNTFDPKVTPNWPLTWEVAPNQGSHAGRANAAEAALRMQSTPLRAHQRHTTATVTTVHSHICRWQSQYDPWHQQSQYKAKDRIRSTKNTRRGELAC